MRTRAKHRKGSALVEFTLVGIPIVFLLFSTFEMARGMWLYHTLAYAVREGSRYASVHGQNCASLPNTCSVSIGQISQTIQSAGVGLDRTAVTLTFTDNSGTAVTCRLDACLTNSTTWPPGAANTPGMKVSVLATCSFTSAIAMFWPGASVQGPLPTMNLPASSTETIKF